MCVCRQPTMGYCYLAFLLVALSFYKLSNGEGSASLDFDDDNWLVLKNDYYDVYSFI